MASIAEDLRKKTPKHTKLEIEYLSTAHWNLLKTASRKEGSVKINALFSKKPPTVIMLAFTREALRLYNEAQTRLQGKLIILCM